MYFYMLYTILYVIHVFAYIKISGFANYIIYFIIRIICF